MDQEPIPDRVKPLPYLNSRISLSVISSYFIVVTTKPKGSDSGINKTCTLTRNHCDIDKGHVKKYFSAFPMLSIQNSIQVIDVI